MSVTNKITDLKRMADDKKQTMMSKTMDTSILDHDFAATDRKGVSRNAGRTLSPSRKTPQLTGNLERPASRMEISYLESELEERVRLVLDSHETLKTDEEKFGDYSLQPHKETMMVTRNKLLAEFNADSNSIQNEPWLDTFIKCECLKVMCDEVSSKLSDILSINSIELGNVLRKLRVTYKQTFEQMFISWKSLRTTFLNNTKEVNQNQQVIKKLKNELDNKEFDMNAKFDLEVARMNREFQMEKDRDLEKLTATEFKMDQMSDTLKYLNGLFKSMQDDTSTLKTGDLASKCYRLEKENAELLEQNANFDQVKVTLTATEKKLKSAELHAKTCEEELYRLKKELMRRDEAINQLMEKDALRNAEIEKLQRISKSKDDELINLDLKDPATSVLCVKCRKGLDDLSNIRQAILGDGTSKSAKVTCEDFRILLPNIKGRRPNRSVPWLRTCMRSILLSKLKEDVCLYGIKGDVTIFSSYVYSWFHRETTGLSGTLLTKLLQQCDEDRWGLYYGVKALNKEDPECMIFWSLLDNSFGNDGLHFVLYCMSVVLTIGGIKLWRQFGYAFTRGGSINVKQNDDSHTLPTIWLEIGQAKDAVRLILTRALASHVAEAMEAIDALKVRPTLRELQKLTEVENSDSPRPAEEGNPETEAPVAEESEATEASEFPEHTMVMENNEDATHINFFMWLRLMLQQMHADQIHRAAAIRLMFETASVGALTPQTNYEVGTAGTSGNTAYGASTAHVEYPQFQSICQTLFPYLPMTEISSLYATCYEVGNKKVNAEVFTKQANLRGYFTYALKLPLLPLLRPYQSLSDAPREGEETTAVVAVTPANNTAATALTRAEKLYSAKTEVTVRSKLATIVHRKLASITPSLKYMMKSLPEKYKNMLNDAMHAVTLSLHDTHLKLRTKEQQEIIAANTSSKVVEPKDTPYIDGLQPFVYYRRLITLASFIKGMCDNPIRPEELFHPDMLDNNSFLIEKAVHSAEHILTSLEQNLLESSSKLGSKSVEKYANFEQIRKILVARRLQNTTKKFVNKDVAIPRSIRTLMSPGYLRQVHANKTSKFLLKNRDVYHEPWYGQAAIAEIYKYKYVYDYKAISMGLECISLPQAVASYHYFLYGSMDFADRAIHDLFTCVKAYRLGVPRLRIFAAFLGDGRELDNNVAEMLRTPHAYNIYMTLLLDLHKELNAVKRDFYTRINGTTVGDIRRSTADMSKIGIDVLRKSNVSGEDTEEPDTSGEYDGDMLHIEVLFPSSENTLNRLDKREVWFCSTKIINKVLRRWVNTQRALYGNAAVYTDLVDKLKTNSWGEVEVDDVLYIVLVQWAKLTSFHVKKSQSRAQLVEQSHLGAVSTDNVDGSAGPVVDSGVTGSGAKVETKAEAPTAGVKKNSNQQLLPTLPTSNLKNIVESIYRPGEGPDFADSQYYTSSYLQRIGSNAANRLVPIQQDSGAATSASSNTPKHAKVKQPKVSMFSKEMEKLLRDCILWDINSMVRPGDGSNPIATAELQTTAAANAASTGGSGKPGSRNTIRAATIVTPAKPSMPGVVNAVEESHQIAPLMFTQCRISLGVNPELSYITARKLFTAYQAPVNVLLTKISENTRFANDTEVSRRIQSIRILMLSLSEIFQQLDTEYVSYKLYVYEATGVERFSDDNSPNIVDEFNQNEFLTSLKVSNVRVSRNESVIMCQQTWGLLQSFLTTISELAISVGEECPRDSWQVGVKMHVDRSFVYNIHTKNSLV